MSPAFPPVEMSVGDLILGMTVSVDGFVADRDGRVGRLYPDLRALQGSDYMKAMTDETGAVLMGRRAFEMGDPDSYVGKLRVPGPALRRDARAAAGRPKQDERLTFTFVTEGGEAAVALAKEAAGAKAVQAIGGASVARQLLAAGLVDQLRVDVMPVLLGSGTRLFEDAGLARLRLRKLAAQVIGSRTSLRYRIDR
jgi:dihydrofolate reductase